MRSTEPRRIGSFFESIPLEISNPTSEIPWARHEDVTYVQTGRQAIAALAAIYAAEGRNIVLVPQYSCESMLVAFDEKHWNLKTYQLNEDMTIDTKDLVSKISSPAKTVILSATYFGNEPTEQYIGSINTLRGLGARVIEDETHRILGSTEPIGDVSIASLRKVLPVADGAYIRGKLSVAPEMDREHLGWVAMDEKSTGNIEVANDLYRRASIDLEGWLQPPARPSRRTLRTLSALNYEELRSKRRENSRALREYLSDVGKVKVINKADIPSHLVVRVPDAKYFQGKLAQVGIYCPIHWPQPGRLSGVEWRHDILSLPVDHRYGVGEMQTIAEQIKLVVENC